MGFQNGGCDLPFTGERVVPGKTPALLVLEHIIRYRFAARFADGARVLDAACGTGYGSSILAKKAKSVIGIDNSLETIRYARQNYSHRNLHYSIADCRLLPFHAGGFDLAVMFEAIEHIAEQEQCLIEIRRILDSKGILILSTPNATRPMKAVEEHNPFHSKELTDQEFLELLRRHFPHAQLLYQHEFSASAIQNTCGPTTELAEVVEDSTNAAGAKYFIAVCGAQPTKVSLTRTLGVVGIDHQIEIVQELRQSQNQIEALKRQRDQNDREYSQSLAMHQQDLQAKQEAIEALLRQREENVRDYSRNLALHQQDLQARQEAIEALLRQREENEREGVKLRKEAADRDRQLAELEIQNSVHKTELEWLYRWMPTNRLARKFLFGRNLRSKMKARFSFLGRARHGSRPLSLIQWERKARNAVDQSPLEFEDSTHPHVSIIIPVHDGFAYTRRCLNAVLSSTAGIDYEVVVVDDCSQDETRQMVSGIKGLRWIRNEANHGFIHSCNRGAEEARGKFLLFLNNDTVAMPQWLNELLKTLESDPKAGAVGAKLVYPDGWLQEAGSILWRDGSAMGFGRGDDPRKPEYSYLREVDYCSAACLLVRKQIFQELGGFDTRYTPAYYEDADLCMGIREKGYKVLFQPKAVIYHREYASGSSGQSKNLMEQNQLKFVQKWRERLQSQYENSLSNILLARDRAVHARILVVDDGIPRPERGSGYPRASALLKFLAELQYKVTLFPVVDPVAYQPYLDDLQQLGIEVVCETDDFAGFCAQRAGFYDVVLVSRPHNLQKTYFSIKKFFPNAGLIYDAEAVFSVRDELKAKVKGKSISPEEVERAGRAELSLLKLTNAAICVSESEKSLICDRKGEIAHRVFVWGHPISPQPTQRPFRERKDILFVGAFTSRESPNEDAVMYFINEVFPEIRKELDCSFCVIGARPPVQVKRKESSHVRVAGFIENLSEYYNGFRIFVVPHRYSAGIPWKLSEAMSRGIPAVVSGLTATQFSLTDGKEVLIGNTPNEFASKVIQLYKDENLWNRIRENALTFIQKTHDPNVLKSRLDDIIRSVLQIPTAATKP